MVIIELDGSIVFQVECPQARRIDLVGAFDGWHPQPYPMTRDSRGWWRVKLNLEPGEYLFRYLVDGTTWALDPQAHGIRQSLNGIPMSRVWRPPLRLDPSVLAA